MKINFNQDLTNFDIENICREMKIPLYGVFMRDTIPEQLPKTCMIVVNLDSSKGRGTHWCACFIFNKNAYWFDSFSFPPPQDCVNTFNKQKIKVWYSDEIYQSIDSVVCGYYCIAYLHYINNSVISRKTVIDVINQWCAKFRENNGRQNDNLIKKIISANYKKK